MSSGEGDWGDKCLPDGGGVWWFSAEEVPLGGSHLGPGARENQVRVACLRVFHRVERFREGGPSPWLWRSLGASGHIGWRLSGACAQGEGSGGGFQRTSAFRMEGREKREENHKGN